MPLALQWVSVPEQHDHHSENPILKMSMIPWDSVSNPTREAQWSVETQLLRALDTLELIDHSYLKNLEASKMIIIFVAEVLMQSVAAVIRSAPNWASPISLKISI